MRNSVRKYGKWAVITGGSAGIGLEFARQLASKGHSIVLVARNAGRLEAAGADLKKTYGVDVKTFALDLTDGQAVQDVLDATSDLDVGLAVLNAGMELSGNYTKTSVTEHQQLLALNVQVPMEMAHGFGARFVAQRRGGIIFLSSLFGYQGVPLVAAYSASKAYVLALGEALSVELKRFGVDVTVLSPGLTDTQMPANMPIDFAKLPVPKMSPKRTAKVGLSALGRKISIVPGLINKIYVWENRLLPRWTPIVMFGWMVRMAFRKSEAPKYLLPKPQKRTA